MTQAITLYAPFIAYWVIPVLLMLIFPFAMAIGEGHPVLCWGGLALSLGGLCLLWIRILDMSRGKW